MAKEPTDDKPKRPTLGINPRRIRQPSDEPPPIMEDVNNLSSAAAAMLTSDDATMRLIKTRIEEVFNALGTNKLPGTVIPVGARNNSAEAGEFVLADMLAKLAKERLNKAAEAAENAGVFGERENYVIGGTVMVYSDPNFSINVKMGKPSKLIKREKVESAAAAYLGKKAPEFLKECQGERAATKQIIVSMK